MTQADRIRNFVLESYVQPARREGDAHVEVRAGDVHREMGLTNAMPAVCSAIGSSKFTELAKVMVMRRSGPKNGSTVMFTFALSAPNKVRVANQMPQERQPSRQTRARHSAPFRPAKDCDLSGALVLVSCVKSKRSTPAPARDLYTSPLFTKARTMVERQRAEWRILSALHGMVDPRTVIEPYEHTLNGQGVAARRAWAEQLLPQLLPLASQFERVVFLAGDRYREFLQEPLVRNGVKVEVPMRGLSLGQQLAWLS